MLPIYQLDAYRTLIFQRIDNAIANLGLKQEHGRLYLQRLHPQRTSRHHLDDEELESFARFLERRVEEFKKIDAAIAELNWDVGERSDYLKTFYNGKINRHQLDEDELEHFSRSLAGAVQVVRKITVKK
jgi:hypothetical protein